jgi:hypothetical protein
MPSIGTWLGALLSLAILSFLYKDNPLFRFAESLFAGVALGYYIGNQTNQTIKPNLVLALTRDFAANWDLIFAGLLGIGLYFRYIKKLAWLARVPLGIYVGYYVGVTITQKLHGEVLPQMKDTILPLSGPGLAPLWNGLMIVGVFSVLLYFFFSLEHRGAVGVASRVGILFVMVSFGAAFGYTVMGRISLLIGRFNFLVNDWLRPLLGAVF